MRSTGGALKFASEELQADVDVQKEAVSGKPFSHGPIVQAREREGGQDAGRQSCDPTRR